ncbi:hypothetical protein FQN50_009423 [Emmonsiellopsis sp. PD_5]|nr:hypothetical protein FQN50_009423 [Emmonsiellopsis sp. PD_5]
MPMSLQRLQRYRWVPEHWPSPLGVYAWVLVEQAQTIMFNGHRAEWNQARATEPVGDWETSELSSVVCGTSLCPQQWQWVNAEGRRKGGLVSSSTSSTARDDGEPGVRPAALSDWSLDNASSRPHTMPEAAQDPPVGCKVRRQLANGRGC